MKIANDGEKKFRLISNLESMCTAELATNKQALETLGQ